MINSIEDVIKALDAIIINAKEENSPLGYFAALYREVTIKVKNAIEGKDPNITFQDNARMEQLDVIFASRYIEAYYEYKAKKATTESWHAAFMLSEKFWPIVLQHLLIGMNAHINLDLGIAAAQVMKGKNINDLETDFNKINELLASLVGEVESDLSRIWPTLKKILKWTQSFDDFLINFSMKKARESAWEFAVALSKAKEPSEFENKIKKRDQETTEIANLISAPGFIASLLFKIIRLGERGSVAQKIGDLEY